MDYGRVKSEAKALGSGEGEFLKDDESFTSNTSICDNFASEVHKANNLRKEILMREKAELDFSGKIKENSSSTAPLQN